MKSFFRFLLFFLALNAVRAADVVNEVNPWEH